MPVAEIESSFVCMTEYLARERHAAGIRPTEQQLFSSDSLAGTFLYYFVLLLVCFGLRKLGPRNTSSCDTKRG
jgi:hypothetical protein